MKNLTGPKLHKSVDLFEAGETAIMAANHTFSLSTFDEAWKTAYLYTVNQALTEIGRMSISDAEDDAARMIHDLYDYNNPSNH